MPFHGFAKRTASGPRWTGKVALVPEKLGEPLSWKKPQRVFVNSMSDLFHEELHFEHIAAVFGVMAACPHITFQVLTKRPARAVEFFSWIDCPLGRKYLQMGESQPAASALWWGLAALGDDRRSHAGEQYQAALRAAWPLSNVWLGTSVESQETADARIPLLLRCPAAVRFVSYEPALGPVDFREYLTGREENGVDWKAEKVTAGMCTEWTPPLDWIIAGGESGPGARPFDIEWARSTVQQCKAAGIPVFCKQLGACPTWNGCSGPGEHWPIGTKKEDGFGFWKIHLKDKKGGDPEEWPEDLRVREFPEVR